MRTFRTEFARLGLLQKRRREEALMNGKASDKREERLTDRDFRELMGEYRPTYKRVNGRIRRR